MCTDRMQLYSSPQTNTSPAFPNEMPPGKIKTFETTVLTKVTSSLLQKLLLNEIKCRIITAITFDSLGAV